MNCRSGGTNVSSWEAIDRCQTSGSRAQSRHSDFSFQPAIGHSPRMRMAPLYQRALDKCTYKAYHRGWRADTILVGSRKFGSFSGLATARHQRVGWTRYCRVHYVLASTQALQPDHAARSKSSSSNLMFFIFPFGGRGPKRFESRSQPRVGIYSPIRCSTTLRRCGRRRCSNR